MGNNTSSGDIIPVDTAVMSQHEQPKSKTQPDRDEYLHKTVFISKIPNPYIARILGNKLWIHYTKGGEEEAHDASLESTLSTDKFSSLIADLKSVCFSTSPTTKYEFLLNHFHSPLALQDCIDILKLLRFDETIRDESLHDALFKTLSSENTSIDRVDFQLKLVNNLPDGCDDLLNFVLRSFDSSNHCFKPTRVNEGSTELMTSDLIWLLSGFLSTPFKRIVISDQHTMTPYELEQLNHLQIIYNSKIDGFSLTRIKHSSFEYEGPILLLIKTQSNHFFCLAIDCGLRDSGRPYGGEASRLVQFLPQFSKLVSGRSSGSGIVYSNFTLKTAKRGLLVGHQPLSSPVIEIDEDFTSVKLFGGQKSKIACLEIWAAGTSDHLDQLKDNKARNLKAVDREKNRKLKLDVDWKDSADRSLLSMGGVNVRHSDALEQLPPPVSK